MADSVKEQEVLPLESAQHPLKYSYTFHVVRRKPKGKTASANASWAENIEEIGSFGTVEQFWAFYNHMIRPSEFPNNDFHMFRKGIVPMWEDPANQNGGKFVVRSKKRKVADRYWEEMLLAIIGEQFEHSQDICGVVISSRSTGDDVLSVWNKTSNDDSIVNSIRDKIKQVLGLPANLNVEYKAHNQSIAETLNAANQASTPSSATPATPATPLAQ